MGRFCGAHLERAHFEKAHLEGAHFEMANINGVDHDAANLEGAFLTAAYLTGAYIEPAQIAKAMNHGHDAILSDGQRQQLEAYLAEHGEAGSSEMDRRLAEGSCNVPH